jgi:2-amino-4-hydroxy-6-hydroxymethyldihydropteridine diphosphokinase
MLSKIQAKIEKNMMVVALGSNLGNRLFYLHKAEELMSRCFGKAVLGSSIYTTPAWGIENQASFLNSVLLFDTDKSAQNCLKILRSVEQDLGRKRFKKWGPRCIDLDILYYGQEMISSNELEIPHPHLQDREFVLVPLCEILPDFIHPKFQKNQEQLLKDLLQDKRGPSAEIFSSYVS